ANVVNLAMFLMDDTSAQSSAEVLGQAVTMIMSQRIILSLQEWTGEPSLGLPQSRSGPDFAMHVVQGETRLNGTPTSKVRYGWAQPTNVRSMRDVWNNRKHSYHTRKAPPGDLGLGDDDTGGVHIVVEREIRYIHDDVNNAERTRALNGQAACIQSPPNTYKS
ncbi:hypothetical protein FRC11_010426, partial [Ceratobasidium sp. 423]